MYRDIFLAGGIAGAVQAIPACPIELVKVKLQVQKGSNLYPISNWQKISFCTLYLSAEMYEFVPYN